MRFTTEQVFVEWEDQFQPEIKLIGRVDYMSRQIVLMENSVQSWHYRLLISSLDHLVRPEQHRLRNRQVERIRGLEIDCKLKLCRLLDG